MPGGTRAVGEDHVKDIEIGVGAGFEGEAEGDEAVFGPLAAVEIGEPFVANKDAGQGAERAGQGVGELQALTQAMRGEGFLFVPAPFHAVAPFQGEVRGEIEMRIQLQLGPELGEAILCPGVFDAEQGEADAAIEPGEQGMFKARAGDLHIGTVVCIQAVAEEEQCLAIVIAPELQRGPGPPFVGAGGGDEAEGE